MSAFVSSGTPGPSSSTLMSTPLSSALIHSQIDEQDQIRARSLGELPVVPRELGGNPDPPTVPFDDLLADRQADARAGVLVARVEALEDPEDPILIVGGNADAVVADRDDPFGVTALRSQMDGGSGVAAELDCVADQVLEQVDELRLVAENGGELVPGQRGAALGEGGVQARDGSVGTGAEVDRLVLRTPPTREKARSLMSACIRIAPSTA
jgi:hypothetical protein